MINMMSSDDVLGFHSIEGIVDGLLEFIDDKYDVLGRHAGNFEVDGDVKKTPMESHLDARDIERYCKKLIASRHRKYSVGKTFLSHALSYSFPLTSLFRMIFPAAFFSSKRLERTEVYFRRILTKSMTGQQPT
jgi:hypothetical protein